MGWQVLGHSAEFFWWISVWLWAKNLHCNTECFLQALSAAQFMASSKEIGSNTFSLLSTKYHGCWQKGSYHELPIQLRGKNKVICQKTLQQLQVDMCTLHSNQDYRNSSGIHSFILLLQLSALSPSLQTTSADFDQSYLPHHLICSWYFMVQWWFLTRIGIKVKNSLNRTGQIDAMQIITGVYSLTEYAVQIVINPDQSTNCD